MEFVRDYGKTAVIYDGKEYSYKETIIGAKSYKNLLKIEKEDKVVIFMENRPEFIYAFLGIWDKGGTTVCLDSSFGSEELEYYLKDCEPKYIFTSEKNYKAAVEGLKLSGKESIILNVDNIEMDYRGEDMILNSPEKDAVALMLYTSGTTGSPKGVMLTFDNILVNIEGLDKYQMYKESDRILALLPMHHIFPLLGSGIIPLSRGATIAFIKELSSQAMTDALKNYEISIMIGVPRLWEMLHKKIMEKINSNPVAKKLFKICEKLENKNLSKKIFKKVHEGFGGKIRFFVSGGSKLDPKVSKDFLTLGIDVCEGYGLTETAPMISFTPINQVVPGSAGKIMPGVEVKIAEDGEILSKGRNLMKGYYNKPLETAEVIDADGWFHTGDLGELKGEYLYVTGRKKEMIVLSNGKNINPIDIEMWIMGKTDLIQEMAVIEYESLLTAVIYPNFQSIQENHITNIGETLKWGVIDKYNNTAPNYRKILDIKIVQEELPKTKIGKIRRFMVPELLKEKKIEDIVIETPNYEEYIAISDYLKDVKKKEISPTAHLELDLGMDSLDIVELIAFLEGSFGVKITENVLVNNPTVEKLSEYIRENATGMDITETNWGEILKVESSEFLPKSNSVGTVINTLFKIPFSIYIKIKKSGLENLDINSPVIFVGNHQSFLDGFIFNQSISKKIFNNTYFLAKVAHFKKGALKYIGENSNLILIDINKNLSETLQAASTALKNGKNIVIFPEGVRSRDGKMREFKKAFAILAKEINVDVIPFGIKGAYELYPANVKFPNSGEVEIKFFPKISSEKLSYEEIVKKSHDTIEKWVQE
ncbi:AMP-binding protein [Cetobacterium sp. 2A]|uniref:AMP-binding protein n=1 Tax=Cetobacterium sp. 2A TaxID=2754723 RepID=UPI00163D1FAB|nr:AMP-binding protein [Cetobacterium sp. 2A]MBC2856739.1 AMP-binding protein [Cetobacterium sp. 2A]